MTAVYALQGKVKRTTLDHTPIALSLGLEPPSFHRPRGLGRPVFVNRRYKLATYDQGSDTAVYLAQSERWLD